jgi:hypothetical protein
MKITEFCITVEDFGDESMVTGLMRKRSQDETGAGEKNREIGRNALAY